MRMHYVDGSRIRDSATGKEIMWRGAGGSYFLHGSSLATVLQAWQDLYIPLAKQAGFNTMRLAFRFDWDIYGATGDVFDFTNMDAVVELLGQNGLKVILDHHGTYTPNQMLNPLLSQSWQQVAAHYRGNENIAAYEVYNEPSPDSGVTSAQNIQGYHDLTLAIRTFDPDHICIWETPVHYIPSFDKIPLGVLLPNVVYTAHRWWTNKVNEIIRYGANELSKMVFDEFMFWRDYYNIPIWLGEFGGPGGGNHSHPYDPNDEDWTKPYWDICAELLWRSEEQVVPWNLWLGTMSTTVNKLAPYMPLLPPKNFNTNLIRQPWQGPATPSFARFIKSMNGVDTVGNYQLNMWHKNDSVTFNPGIIIKVVRSHDVGEVDVNGNCPVGTWKDGKTPPHCWQDFEEIISVTEETTVKNEEGTTAYPGDWNMSVYSVGYVEQSTFPLILLLAVAFVLASI